MVAIRRAVAADAPALARLLRDAFAEHEKRYTPRAFAATCPPPDVLATRLAEGPTWIAEEEGAAVGTVSARLDGGAAHVRSMAVHPRARGRGVGRVLLARLESHARAAGATRLTLSTTPFLHHAIRLYEGAGFFFVAKPDGDLHGTPLATMEKPLHPARRA